MKTDKELLKRKSIQFVTSRNIAMNNKISYILIFSVVLISVILLLIPTKHKIMSAVLILLFLVISVVFLKIKCKYIKTYSFLSLINISCEVMFCLLLTYDREIPTKTVYTILVITIILWIMIVLLLILLPQTKSKNRQQSFSTKQYLFLLLMCPILCAAVLIINKTVQYYFMIVMLDMLFGSFIYYLTKVLMFFLPSVQTAIAQIENNEYYLFIK